MSNQRYTPEFKDEAARQIGEVQTDSDSDALELYAPLNTHFSATA